MKQVMCNVCGKRRGQTGTKGTETSPHHDMCNYCFEEGGMENGHSDNGHHAINARVEAADGFTTELTDWEKSEWEGFMQSCWICHPELNLAQTQKSTKVQDQRNSSVAGFTRRQQLNHKGHSHPATSAARRACKEAFWASLTPVANVSTDQQMAAAMVAWDYQCDASGKPVAKPITWTVAPRGPKGGVINQMKAAKPVKKFTARGLGIMA